MTAAELRRLDAVEVERDALRAEVERLRVELSAAVAAEREECAKVCDDQIKEAETLRETWMAEECAAAIRARSTPDAQSTA